MGYGYCGSCYSNDCNCGRQTVLQQSVSSCCSTGSSAKFCKEAFPYLTANFTVPEANTDVEVKVSDSAKLYVGQGIQISDGYYQITEITDSKTISIQHDGTATPGTVVTAISGAYGCYSYPIYYVGIVEITYTTEDIEGVDSSFAPVVSSIVGPELVFTYGYLGPDKIQFNMALELEIANTPEFIEIPLPEAGSEPSAAFSAVLITSAEVPSPLIAYKRSASLIVGPGAGTNFSNATGLTILVSGKYGV